MEVFDGYPVQFQCVRCGATPTTAPSSEFKLATESVLVVVCGGCNLPTMIRASEHRGVRTRPDGRSDNFRNPLEQIPEPTIESFDPGVVPEPIARRYADAQRARNAGLWEQAIGTSRTAVQTMCRLEDVKRGRLVDEIDRLLDKKGSELPELVKTMAHRIRDAGNDALHPDDPTWNPTKAEADEAIQFLKAILEWLYAMPARLRDVEKDVGGEQDAETEEGPTLGGFRVPRATPERRP